MGSQLRLGVEPRSRTTRINNVRDAGAEALSTPALFPVQAAREKGVLRRAQDERGTLLLYTSDCLTYH